MLQIINAKYMEDDITDLDILSRSSSCENRRLTSYVLPLWLMSILQTRYCVYPLTQHKNMTTSFATWSLKISSAIKPPKLEAETIILDYDYEDPVCSTSRSQKQQIKDR